MVLDRLLDLDVPAARHRVQGDRPRHPPAARNQPVARYRFFDEEGRELQGELELGAGWAELPPLGFGRLDVTLKVAGYRDGELAGLTLWPDAPGANLVAELDRSPAGWRSASRKTATSRWKAPSCGCCATGCRTRSPGRAAATARARIRVPGEYAGLPVLVRAPKMGFHVELLPEPNTKYIQWWLEPPPAKEKTTVVVVDQNNQPIAGAEVLLGIDIGSGRAEKIAGMAGRQRRRPRRQNQRRRCHCSCATCRRRRYP